MKLRAKPLERLVDANPCWVDQGGPNVRRADGSPVPERRGIMLSFDCPIHEDCLLGVPVNPPLDGGPVLEETTWTRTGGEDFDTVTLSPSIRIVPASPDACAWHGFIRNGRFQTCGDSR